MSTPQAVQEADRIADEAFKAQFEQPATETAPPAEAPPVSDTPPTGEPGSAPPQPTGDEWKVRYDTLIGKYNAEVPRLHSENAYLKSELTAMQQRMRDLEDKVSSAPSQPEGPPEDVVRGLEVLKEQMPEVYEAMKWEIQKNLSEFADSHFKTVEGRVKEVETAASSMAKQSFEDRLAVRVKGDWQRINTMPDFLQWLQGPVPYLNMSKLELLRQASVRGDADTVAKFFNDFIETQNPAARLPQPSAFVAPPKDSASAAAKDTGPGQKMWKRSEIKKIYDDYGAGRYKYRMEEFDKLQKEIDTAINARLIIDD